MELGPHADALGRQLVAAAEAGGDDARRLAERLLGPLEASVRLMLLEVLSAAADEITSDLAPGSVELRLRGGEPEFVVVAPAGAPPPEPGPGVPTGPPAGAEPASAGEEGATSRINLRLPEQLKARIEEAAERAGLSVNAWVVRAASGALDADRGRGPAPDGGWGQRFTGWVR